MKNIALAIASGLLLAAAWPTYGFACLIFVAWVPLLFAEHRIRQKQTRTQRKVFACSYLTFLIWNALTTWWIWNATPLGMLFAVLVNSLLMSVVFMAYHLVAQRRSPKIALIFLIAFWISFEKFHLNWDFSWPWLNLGNVFSENITWVQWYQYTGVFGGSLWVWLVNVLIFIFLGRCFSSKDKKILLSGAILLALLVGLPIVASQIIFAQYQPQGKTTQVLVLQPNIDPYAEKYNISNVEMAQILTDLAHPQMSDKISFIIAPETVFAENIPIDNFLQQAEIQELKRFIEPYPKASILSGVAMYRLITNPWEVGTQSNYLPKQGIWFNDYNSAFLLNAKNKQDFYHKSKLVVGVENMPFQQIIKPLLGNVMIDLGGTVAVKTTQEEPSVFVGMQGEKAAPVICYESVYGQYVAEYARKGAEFLAIITNDAWWGNTQGHKQLLSYARLRAIETRRDIARSANSGISAMINQRGEILQKLSYQTQGVLKASVQLNDAQTFYTRYGDYIARICIYVSVGILLISFAKKRFTL